MATQAVCLPEEFCDHVRRTGPAIETAGPIVASGYRHSRRLNLPALAATLAVCGTLFGSLVFLGNVGHHHRHRFNRLTVMDLHELHRPPPRSHAHAMRHVELRTTPVPDQPITVPIVAPPIVPISLPSPILVAPGAAPAPSEQGHAAGAQAEGHDLASNVLDAPPPAYPIDARRLKEQGVVVLLVSVAEDGRVADIAIKQGSGSYRLDRAALSAVRRWRWSPVMAGGEAVAVQGYVTIPFVLKS